MIAAVLVGAWVAAMIIAGGLCVTAKRADRVIESWDAERLETSRALALLGDDADGLWS